MASIDLRRAAGSPPQTTMRNQLRMLTRIGIVERCQQAEFPRAVDYQLGKPGHELLEVATHHRIVAGRRARIKH